MCATQRPVWDVGGGLSSSSFLKSIVHHVGSCPHTHNLRMNPGVLWCSLPKISSLCDISSTFWLLGVPLYSPLARKMGLCYSSWLPSSHNCTCNRDQVVERQRQNKREVYLTLLVTQPLWSKMKVSLIQFYLSAGPTAASLPAVVTTITGLPWG